MKNSLPKLIVASSEENADLLYATHFFVPDPVIFLSKGGRSTLLLSDLEIDRGRKSAQVDEVIPLSDISARLPAGKDAPLAEHLSEFLRMRKVRRALVPRSFPLGLAMHLAKKGVKLLPQEGLFWPAREWKNGSELRRIRRALEITEIGMARGIEVLRAATIGKRKLLRWGGGALTSERLRAEIESAILYAGGQPANTIVAGGEQACDPHERGHGPLRGNELIILDIFPRVAATGYYGDLTRTVVRGRATEAQRQLWQTCLSGQQLALKSMKPRVNGKVVQERVKDYFAEQGYRTGQANGRWQGFFHGLGHGLGLELHEEPRIAKTTLQVGQVFTVEPGLYYPGIGGARHEDVVTVAAKGVRLLSTFPKELEV